MTEEERAYLEMIREESQRRFEQRQRAMEQAQCAPPRMESLPPDVLRNMTPSEQANYFAACGGASLSRYAGRPDLLMEEHPRRDFRRHTAEQRIKEAEERLRVARASK
jgi:hypothetical protein